jgi:hypothetical protein
MTLTKPAWPPITDQLWAWFFVVTGILTVASAHFLNYPTDIGAGIIGAGLNAFNSATKQTANVDHANNVTQNTTEK